MRDGIYKDLPVPRCWKSVLRCCERESERGSILGRAIDRAIRRDARREITPVFLRRVLKMAVEGGPRLPGIGQFQVYANSRELGGSNLPVENSMLRSLCRLERGGHCGEDLVVQALTSALVERCDSMHRHAQQHYISRAGDAARPAMMAMECAMDERLIRTIAMDVVSGKRVAQTRMRTPIDVDSEDLSAVR